MDFFIDRVLKPAHSRYQGTAGFKHNKSLHFDKDFNEVDYIFKAKENLLRKLACFTFLNISLLSGLVEDPQILIAAPAFSVL